MDFSRLHMYSPPQCVPENTGYTYALRAAPAAYGGSQARGRIGAAAAGLRQSHSHAGSKPSLYPTPQLTARPDPSPTEQGQGSKPRPRGS